MRKYTVMMIIVALVLCFSVAPSATAASDEEDIIRVQMDFMKAYAAKDFKAMASLYLHSSKTSTFNPGNQPLLCEGWEESLKNRWENTIYNAVRLYGYCKRGRCFPSNLDILSNLW